MAEERDYCVYIHINKINNKKYVGITKKSPKKRWSKGIGYKQNIHFWNAIQKYGWDSFTHLIIRNNLPKACACTLEKILIKVYDTTNPNKGYNNSEGGESGRLGTKWTIESKLKSSKSHFRMFLNGPCSKTILQYDLNENLIKEWPSAMEVERSLGFNNANITRCASGKRKTAYKYIWKWKK